METTVLIVEDDPNLQRTLVYNLSREGYRALTAGDGAAGIELARREKPSLIVLDIMLPIMNGLEVCRVIRQEMNVPILMLTARAEETDKVIGLEMGADDYVTKPFGMREFIARVHALLRRAASKEAARAAPEVIAFGDITLDPARHRITRGGEPLELTPKEYDLLAFLARNKSFVFSREQLLEKVWGYEYAGDTRTVDVHIRWLRRKIEADPHRPHHLVTVRGTGYKLEE